MKPFSSACLVIKVSIEEAIPKNGSRKNQEKKSELLVVSTSGAYRRDVSRSRV